VNWSWLFLFSKLFSFISPQNTIQILTGDEVNTEGHNFSVLIEANSQYLFCYITDNRKKVLHSAFCLTNIFELVISTGM